MGGCVLRLRDHTFFKAPSMSRMNYWLHHFKIRAFSVPPASLEVANIAVTYPKKDGM